MKLFRANRLNLLSLVFTLFLVTIIGGSIQASTTIPTGPDSAETTGDAVNITLNPTAMTVDGCTAPYSLVTIFDNNLAVGTVVANGAGLYSKYIILNKHGLHNVKAYGEDSLGLKTDTVTRNISARDHFNNIVHTTLPPTISISRNIYTSGEQITFVGMSCPNTNINLNIDNTISLDVKTNSKGEWFAILSSVGFSFGEHSFNATRTNELGNIVSSQKQLFRIVKSQKDSKERDAIDIDDLQPPTITLPDDNYLSSSSNVILTGTAQPNVQIEIFLDGRIVGSVFSNPLGEWSFTFTMTASQHSLEARACISYGCSVLSNEVTIFYQGVLGECNFEFRFSKYRFFRHSSNKGLDLELQKVDSLPPYSLLIDWGDDAVENTQLAQNRTIKYHHVYRYVGNYNGIVTLQDSLGCIQTQFFSVEVVENHSALSWFLWVIFITYIYAIAYSQKNPFKKIIKRKKRTKKITHNAK